MGNLREEGTSELYGYKWLAAFTIFFVVLGAIARSVARKVAAACGGGEKAMLKAMFAFLFSVELTKSLYMRFLVRVPVPRAAALLQLHSLPTLTHAHITRTTTQIASFPGLWGTLIASLTSAVIEMATRQTIMWREYIKHRYWKGLSEEEAEAKLKSAETKQYIMSVLIVISVAEYTGIALGPIMVSVCACLLLLLTRAVGGVTHTHTPPPTPLLSQSRRCTSSWAACTATAASASPWARRRGRTWASSSSSAT